MEAQEAARALRRVLKAPIWALNTAAWKENGRICLIVRVDPSYRGNIAAPETFEGFPVVVQRRSTSTAQAS
jgi:hypothetical protein